MPWTAKDASRYTKKASTGKSQRQWSAVANSALARGLPDGVAIREANGVIKKHKGVSSIHRAMGKK